MITARGSEGSIVFSVVAKVFLCWRDNSWTAAVHLVKFCMNMYLNNLTNPVEFQGHMGFCVFYVCLRAALSLERGFFLLLTSWNTLLAIACGVCKVIGCVTVTTH